MAKSMLKSTTEATQVEVISKPKAEPQPRPAPTQPPAPTKEKAVVQLKPPIMMGKALEQSSPPPRREPQVSMVEGTQEESVVPSREVPPESREKSQEQPREKHRESTKEKTRESTKEKTRGSKEKTRESTNLKGGDDMSHNLGREDRSTPASWSSFSR